MLAVKRALLLSTCDRYFALVSNFATAAIVSRILTPQEIGVSVIGMAVIGIALSTREFASASFLIQRQELNRGEIRAAFSVLLVLTAAIAAAMVVLTPVLASAYGEERLVPYLHLVSICLFIDLIFLQVIPLLRRDMAFGKVAIINISGAAIGALTTVVLALLGFSYMSFAWAWFASSVTMGLLALSLRPHFWMFKPSFRQWRGMVEFGGYNGVIVFLSKAYEALPFLLLGRVLSPDAAALYSRSLMICQIPDKLVLGGAVSVILPAFSAEARQGRDLKRPYLGALEMITALHWPALLVVAVLAHPIVDILLGQQWQPVAPLVQVIAIASLFSFSFEMNYPVLVAVGAIRDLFYRSLIIFPVSAALMTAAILLGGLQGAAWSTMLIVPFHAFVSLQFVRRRLAMGWAEIAGAVWKSGVVALVSALGPLAAVVAAGFSFELSIGQAIVAGILAMVCWLGGLVLTRHPLFAEIMKTIPVIRRAITA